MVSADLVPPENNFPLFPDTSSLFRKIGNLFQAVIPYTAKMKCVDKIDIRCFSSQITPLRGIRSDIFMAKFKKVLLYILVYIVALVLGGILAMMGEKISGLSNKCVHGL